MRRALVGAVGVGVPGRHGGGEAVGDGVGLGVGVGDGTPTAAAMSTRPHPYTLLGRPPASQRVELMKNDALSRAVRLALIWCRRLGIAHQSKPMAPAICGVAIDVPLAVV